MQQWSFLGGLIAAALVIAVATVPARADDRASEASEWWSVCKALCGNPYGDPCI